MFVRSLGAVAAVIVIVLGLHVWRGRPTDVGRTPLNGEVPTRPEADLASPASMPAQKVANLKLLQENLPSPDKKRLVTLEEILASKNDNDPRLDSDFRQLSPEVKRALEGRYHTTAKEKLNERGTVVFLLGREANTPADFAFLQSVTRERPCLSLLDCRKAEEVAHAANDAHEEHDDGINERTLVYPQTVALKSMERALQSPATTAVMRQSTLKFLREMAHHDDRRISAVAQAILQRTPQ